MDEMTTRDVAEYANVSQRRAAHIMREQGVQPLRRELGGQYVYDAEEARRAIDSRPGMGARTDLQEER